MSVLCIRDSAAYVVVTVQLWRQTRHSGSGHEAGKHPYVDGCHLENSITSLYLIIMFREEDMVGPVRKVDAACAEKQARGKESLLSSRWLLLRFRRRVSVTRLTEEGNIRRGFVIEYLIIILHAAIDNTHTHHITSPHASKTTLQSYICHCASECMCV